MLRDTHAQPQRTVHLVSSSEAPEASLHATNFGNKGALQLRNALPLFGATGCLMRRTP